MTNEADKPSVDGLMEVARQYAHCYFNTGNGNVTHEPLSAFEGRLRTYAARLASAAAPAAQPATPLREVLSDERIQQMRLTLLGQVHELIDIAERHAWTDDAEEKRRTLGAIEHARKVTAPYNFNGALLAASSDEERKLRNALFEAGWRLAARWAHRDDLYADTGSAAYVRDRDAVLAELDRLLGEKT